MRNFLLKKLTIGFLIVLSSTGLFANTVNIAPIITYLLSDTKATSTLSASDFTMTLDVDDATVMENWKILSSVNDTETTTSIKTQGVYGIFEVTNDSLSYLKVTETNVTDSGILEITNGTDTIEITITLESLYWKQVSTGYGHTAAVKSDGTLWTWGANSFGQLGDNTMIEKLVPTQEFSKSSNWSSVSTGYGYTAAIKSNGTLWSWG
ncbi:MAG: hypothetical protein U9O64_05790 [Campylobacterota bacterium]|nr:hypothetical protein [Campylobacterota bacterium]